MQLVLVIVVFAVFGLIYLLIERERRRQPAPTAHATLEARLERLAACGIALSPEHTIEEFVADWHAQSGSDLRADPRFERILEALGWDASTTGVPFCESLWSVDTECIENHGDYARIVRRMAALTRGSLALEDVRDYVDIEAGMASVGFTLDGETHDVICEVDGDWVDARIFGLLNELLAATDPSKTFLYLDLGGQMFLTGCVTHENLRRLRELGVDARPLR